MTQRVKKFIEEGVNDLKSDIDTSWYISWNKIINYLDSHLGFTRSELFDILSEIDIAGATTVKEDALFII